MPCILTATREPYIVHRRARKLWRYRTVIRDLSLTQETVIGRHYVLFAEVYGCTAGIGVRPTDGAVELCYRRR
jgi:hypothetical protein